MAQLSIVERRQLETLFDMGGGYVLDFSNRTFEEFAADSVGIEIYDDRYHHGSGSKANRLRGFWKLESNELVGKLIRDLIEYYDLWEKHSIMYDGLVELIVNCMEDVKPGFIEWEQH